GRPTHSYGSGRRCRGREPAAPSRGGAGGRTGGGRSGCRRGASQAGRVGARPPGRRGPAGGALSPARRRAPGSVHLVGAGPGDPGLLTVRGRDLLASADVVICDALVARELLRFVRPGAELIQ